MKVLDLRCSHGHTFEGWFSSEDDFQGQLTGMLLECPLCGDKSVVKCLSAPRLNLSGASESAGTALEHPAPSAPPSDTRNDSSVASLPPAALQAAWMHMVRRVMAHTEDVGERFAEEARRMHYGETDERAIRGQATLAQTEDLLDEGIEVMPLPLPDDFKDRLH
ncbi:DUF1178 family protein [Ottowia sp.]|uniref:DUF1178 family protein n=1 Tax=Ottowia sp. TaxID=1898956 RepID=UPI003A87F3CF